MPNTERESSESPSSPLIRSAKLPDEAGQTLQRLIVNRPAGGGAVDVRLGPRAGAAERVTAVTATDLREFVDRVLSTNEDSAGEQVREMIARGVSVEDVYIGLLAPSARVLGDRWCNDTSDFVEVTIALGRMQRVVRELAMVVPAERQVSSTGSDVLLSCIPGEQHTLGLFIVAEFFVRDGWCVRVGLPFTDRDLLRLVREEWFDAIGFSVACDSSLPQLRRAIASVRLQSMNRRIGVLVGGATFHDTRLVERVGADGWAPDAAGAPAAARAVIRSPSTDRDRA